MKNYLWMLLVGLGAILASCEQETSNIAPDGEAILEFTINDNPEGNEGARIKDGHLPPTCQDDLIQSVFVRIGGVGYELTPQFFPGIGRWQVQLLQAQPKLQGH